jgi:glycosyltransferase involved in cell wall biosynthesis
VVKVTVVVATYNSPVTLEAALKSVLAQTFAHFEVWVVGDADTAGSGAVVAGLGDPRLNWRNRTANSGSQSAPNSEGLERATGEYVAYLGHDDLWLPDHLASLLARISETQADLVHAVVGRAERQGPWRLSGLVDAQGDEATFVPPSGWLHRRELVEELGGWGDADRGFRPVDLDLLRRASGAAKSMRSSGRLTVLKFPSPEWGGFGVKHGFVQPQWWSRIGADAEAVREEVLARAEPTAPPPPSLLRALAALYGRDRWPLSRFVAWRYQRGRRRLRARRGMPR